MRKALGYRYLPPDEALRLRSGKLGNIVNFKLIQASKRLIDYIIHKLCHYKEHNHSTVYCRLLDHILADWRTWEA